jgi:hypothetical protein
MDASRVDELGRLHERYEELLTEERSLEPGREREEVRARLDVVCVLIRLVESERRG